MARYLTFEKEGKKWREKKHDGGSRFFHLFPPEADDFESAAIVNPSMRACLESTTCC